MYSTGKGLNYAPFSEDTTHLLYSELVYHDTPMTDDMFEQLVARRGRAEQTIELTTCLSNSPLPPPIIDTPMTMKEANGAFNTIKEQVCRIWSAFGSSKFPASLLKRRNLPDETEEEVNVIQRHKRPKYQREIKVNV